MVKEQFRNIEMEQNLMNQTPNPILFTGFYRSGTTFLGEVLKSETRAVTEPLGYFTDISHEQLLTKDEFDQENLHSSFSGYDIVFHRIIQSWLNNESNDTKPALIKETEVAFHIDWLSKVLPEKTQILFVHRDPRGIIASFKSSNLYNSWQFDKRFNELSTTVKTQSKMNKYKPMIQEVKDGDWIDKLSAYYSIAMEELEESIQNWSGNVVAYRYETLMQEPSKEVARIVTALGLRDADKVKAKFNLMTSYTSSNATLDPHAVFKKNVNVYDWQSILTLEESKRIEKFMHTWNRSKDLINIPVANDILHTEGGIGQAKERKKIKEKEYAMPNYMSREEIINEILQQSIPIETHPYKKIAISATHITNDQMAYFFNWLHNQGIPLTKTKPNPFINDVLLSRVRNIATIWQTEEDFKDHPATYCTHLAYTAFALWCGGRLPTVLEWEYAASGGKDTVYPWGNTLPNTDVLNYAGSKGKTTPVRKLGIQNTYGFYDMAGNVADWTSDIDFTSFEAVTKGGSYKDLAENLQIKSQAKRLISLGAMSVGARVAFDEDRLVLHDKDFLQKIHDVISSLNNEKILKQHGVRELMQNVYQILR